MERWEFLVQGLALLAVVAQTSRVQEDAVDFDKYNRLMVAISKSGIQPTEEDNQQIQKLAGAVFQGSDEADAPQTLLKTKFDPSPLGLNTPNPDFKPYLRDLRRDILKKELKLDKAELKGELALQVSRML